MKTMVSFIKTMLALKTVLLRASAVAYAALQPAKARATNGRALTLEPVPLPWGRSGRTDSLVVLEA